jgi:hypothetical protein
MRRSYLSGARYSLVARADPALAVAFTLPIMAYLYDGKREKLYNYLSQQVWFSIRLG